MPRPCARRAGWRSRGATIISAAGQFGGRAGFYGAALSFLLVIVSGWVHRHQLIVIEFLQTEDQLLEKRLRGKRIRDKFDARTGGKNLIWSPVANRDLGLEYIHANRETEDGLNGHLNRLQASAKYAF